MPLARIRHGKPHTLGREVSLIAIRIVFWRRLRTELALAGLSLAVLLGAWGTGVTLRPAAGPVPAAPIYRVETAHRAVALAINVVWGTQYVPGIVRALIRSHATATFFLGGAWAAAHPGLVRQLVQAGMEVGNHGYAHRHQSTLSFDANVDEILRATRAIELAGGVRPTLFAPPYGEYNRTVEAAAAALHMPLIMWTVDTIDWRPDATPAVISGRVLAGVQPGAIILMHPTDRTLEALPGLLAALRAMGYQIVTVSQLLSWGRPAGESSR